MKTLLFEVKAFFGLLGQGWSWGSKPGSTCDALMSNEMSIDDDFNYITG